MDKNMELELGKRLVRLPEKLRALCADPKHGLQLEAIVSMRMKWDVLTQWEQQQLVLLEQEMAELLFGEWPGALA